jgi:hypothetical protein
MRETPMAEAASSITTLVMGDRLPWPDDSCAAGEGGPFDDGAIILSGVRSECSLRKISTLGATLSAALAPALGERVAVELATGQRVGGKVAWARLGELGVRFDDPIDVIALLNRKLVSQARERRTMPRLEVHSAVHVKCGQHFAPATLRNISARGLQIEGDDLPALGSYLAVYAEGLNIPAGEAVWKRGRLLGIELFEELSWSSIIPWVRSHARRQTN